MEIQIQKDYSSRSLAIWLFRGSQPWDKSPEMVAKPVEFEWREISESEPFSGPTLRIPLREARAWLDALKLALDREGEAVPNEHRQAGKMEAMDAHLSDMRRLVYKQQGIPFSK